MSIKFGTTDRRLGWCCQWVLDTVLQTVEWLHQPLGFDSLALLLGHSTYLNQLDRVYGCIIIKVFDGQCLVLKLQAPADDRGFCFLEIFRRMAFVRINGPPAWNKSKPPPIKFVEEIYRAIDLVLASPRRWPTSDLDTRKFVLRRFPYAVIYHERKSVVRILAIAYGHWQPGYWKDRV